MTANFTVGTQGLAPVLLSSALRPFQWAVATGTSDAIAAAYSPPNTALTDGLILGARASAANATQTPTFSPDGLPAAVITKNGGAVLSIGDIAGPLAEILLRYNSRNTRWELLYPARSPSSFTPPIDVSLGAGQTLTITDATYNGNRVVLSGSAWFTVLFQAVGNYSTNFEVRLTNINSSSTGRGQQISIPGYSAFFLMPGQTCRVFNDNGSALRIDKLNQRFVAAGSGGYQCYVDSTLGNDSNDGQAPGVNGAFATIAKALSFIRRSVDLGGSQATINLAAGTYNENLFVFSHPISHHVIQIKGLAAAGSGDWTNAALCVLTCPSPASPIVTLADYCTIIFTGLEMTKAGANSIGVQIGQHCIADFDTIIFGDFTGGTVVAQAFASRGNITGPVQVNPNFNIFWQMAECSSAEWGWSPLGMSIPNALTFTDFITVSTNSTLTLNTGPTSSPFPITGTGSGAGSTGTQYSVAMRGTLSRGGATIPGATGGTTSTGGQVS